jgi:hypothetical protein
LFLGGLREYYIPKMVEKFEKKFLGTWWDKESKMNGGNKEK